MTRILVTGAAGFLGSHLVDALIDQGHEVTGLDNMRRGRMENLERHSSTASFVLIKADIRDYSELISLMEGVEVVFHLAAQSNVVSSLSDPEYSFAVNVMGTYNVLKAAAEMGVRRLIFSSSREVYGEPERLPVKETAATRPKNLYGASKLAGEAYCSAFNGKSSMRCTVLRFGNLYGPRDRDRVIPNWLERAAKDEELILYGGQQVLDFLHVGYAVQALIAAAKHNEFGPINVASGIGTSLDELARRIVNVCSSKSVLTVAPARAIEVKRFVADVSRMETELGISRPTDSLDGLEAMAIRGSESGPSRGLS